jgi:LmbE family N-acetylglucosaminyl deacetylase
MLSIQAAGRYTGRTMIMPTLLRLSPGDRVLVLAPHPDDETLPAGGLLQRAVSVGAAVRVVFITDGDNNPWAQRAVERRWRIGRRDRARWGCRRREEALAALQCLGVPESAAAFLAFPDQGLTDLLLSGDPALVHRLAEEIRRFGPTLLLAPSIDDLHPDHNALAVVSRLALSRVALPAGRCRVLHYVVHRGRGRHDTAAVRIALDAAEVRAKRRAILCHASQLVLRRRFMLGFACSAEGFARPAAPPGLDPRHPIRGARLERGTLVLELVAPRAGLVPSALLVAIEGGMGRSVRLSMRRRVGAIEVHAAAGGATVGLARIERAGARATLTLPLNGHSDGVARGSVFVKLEWPAGRRLGLFDHAGWRVVPVAEREPILRVAAASQGAGERELMAAAALHP